MRIGRLSLSRRRFIQLMIGGAIGGLALYSYGEIYRVTVTRLELGMGAKIAFLTDNHLHGYGFVQENILDLISRESPDIVLIGGDLVDEFTKEMRSVEKFIGGIEAREKYAVIGNHEYWSGLAGEAKRILEDHGFKVLIDEYVDTSIGRLLGLNWRDSREYPDIKTDGLVLVHDPNAADYIDGDAFIFAGHTHGGLSLYGLTIFTIAKYTRGYYKLDNGVEIYVSRGLGQMIPVRPTSPLELLIVE